MASHQELPTFCSFLVRHAFVRGEAPAFRLKSLGIWRTWTWHEVNNLVRAYAVGLSAVGVRRGMTVPVMFSNHPKAYWTFLALHMLGAIPVPLFAEAKADELGDIFAEVDAGIAVVEGEQQIDVLMRLGLTASHTIVFDRSGIAKSEMVCRAVEIDAVIEDGRRALESSGCREWLDKEIACGRGSDVASILYTPGTSGVPKGVVVTFERCIAAAVDISAVGSLDDDDCVIACLPTGWAADHYLTYIQSLVVGFCVACPESSETIGQDTREISPTLYYATASVYDSAARRFEIALGAPNAIGRRVFNFFSRVAQQILALQRSGAPVPLSLVALQALGALIVYRASRDLLGFSRVRLAYVVGEALASETIQFYQALGVEFRYLYGQTETFYCITSTSTESSRSTIVGVPARNVEIRIDDSGEILLKSRGQFVSYFKDENLTRKCISADGFFRTGDIGYLDGEKLVFVDRAENIGRLTTGGEFSSRAFEYELRQSEFIQEAIVVGNGRDCIGALIILDPARISAWADASGVSYSSHGDLVANARLYDLVERSVCAVNERIILSSTGATSAPIIERFMLLESSSATYGREITRIRSLRRSYVMKHMGRLIDALFTDAANAQDKASLPVRVIPRHDSAAVEAA